MIRGNRNIFDPFGWSAALFEWTSSYLLIWPADGRVSRESMRGIYDVRSFRSRRYISFERSLPPLPSLRLLGLTR